MYSIQPSRALIALNRWFEDTTVTQCSPWMVGTSWHLHWRGLGDVFNLQWNKNLWLVSLPGWGLDNRIVSRPAEGTRTFTSFVWNLLSALDLPSRVLPTTMVLLDGCSRWFRPPFLTASSGLNCNGNMSILWCFCVVGSSSTRLDRWVW
jgi:hypothetical protein